MTWPALEQQLASARTHDIARQNDERGPRRTFWEGAAHAAGWYYGKQFGIVPIPVRVPGQKVVAPLGGEDFMVSNSGTKAQQEMSFKFIQGLQKPSQELYMARVVGYMPPKPSVAKVFIKQAGPEWKVSVNETLNAIPRANVLGVKYAKMSQATWTAIDSAIAGTASVKSALDSVASQIETILKG